MHAPLALWFAVIGAMRLIFWPEEWACSCLGILGAYLPGVALRVIFQSQVVDARQPSWAGGMSSESGPQDCFPGLGHRCTAACLACEFVCQGSAQGCFIGLCTGTGVLDLSGSMSTRGGLCDCFFGLGYGCKASQPAWGHVCPGVMSAWAITQMWDVGFSLYGQPGIIPTKSSLWNCFLSWCLLGLKHNCKDAWLAQGCPHQQ